MLTSKHDYNREIVKSSREGAIKLFDGEQWDVVGG